MQRELKKYYKHYIHSDGYLIRPTLREEKHITKGVKHRDGTFRVPLGFNEWLKVVSLSHLVAEHFVDNPNDYQHIKYKDKNYDNTSASNLEWMSAEEYDSRRRTYNGYTMYELPDYPHYYITKEPKVLSSNQSSLDEAAKSGKRYVINNEGEATKPLSIEEIWELANTGSFSRKKHEKKLEAYDERMMQNRLNANCGKARNNKTVIHLPTGTIFDNIKSASDKLGIGYSNIYTHCTGGVKRQKWAYLKDVDEDDIVKKDIGVLEYEDNVEDTGRPGIKVEHIPTGKKFDSQTEAARHFNLSSNSVSKHCNNMVKKPRFRFIE